MRLLSVVLLVPVACLQHIWLLPALVTFAGSIDGLKKKLKEQEIIQRVLKDYDWRVRPRGKNDTWPGN